MNFNQFSKNTLSDIPLLRRRLAALHKKCLLNYCLLVLYVITIFINFVAINSLAITYAMVDIALKKYIEDSILPMYDGFDAAHRRDHVDMVIEQSMEIAKHYDVDENMVYAIAAYHDTGMIKDRKTHHIVSGQIVRDDAWLGEWFDASQIEIIAQAVEDHRASSGNEPRSIYGKIVAEADRFIDPLTIIMRTVQYGLDNYPQLDKEGHWQRTLQHMHEKYAEGGYLKLWFPESPNAQRLAQLREIIKEESELRGRFEAIYDYLTNPHAAVCDCAQCQTVKYRKMPNGSK